MHTTRKVIADATPARDARSSAVRRQVRLATLSPLGEIAQLVEHTTENRGVPGSSPGLAIAKTPMTSGFSDSRSTNPSTAPAWGMVGLPVLDMPGYRATGGV